MATRTTTKKAELKTSTAKPATEKEAPANIAVEPAKTTVKKTAAKKTTVKKAAVKKPAARKTVSKKAVSLNTEVYVQWLGKEVFEKDIVDSIKKIWTEEMGKKEADLVDLKVYIKPEDNGAHYVINGDITGFIGL
ncbi:DUF6465 family protein [Blautia sp. MSJ-19]|uniref:DUF6465 family protein n=1 Tax=Blautia sp. MSJ-19 TaxID=2841517 RepID=UPI001C0E96B5|nr:DUF6465 family protein [Blautia sp. MSJ-19]MBU5481948.1 hypothetical protein [Blautia sp. MSJ-19]